MAYRDDDEQSAPTSNPDYWMIADHNEKKVRIENAEHKGDMHLKRELVKGRAAKQVTKLEAQEKADRLRVLREELSKNKDWQTKTHAEQEKMLNEAFERAHISPDAAIAKENQQKAAEQQGQMERQGQVDD